MASKRRLKRCLPLLWGVAALPLMLAAKGSFAQNHPPSPSVYGQTGLNTVPSARMDKAGTARIGISTLDPYLHGYMGFQFTDSLHVNLRQSAKVSAVNEDPDELYPGVDVKLRLLKEQKFIPEVAIGIQSAVGDKRMSGEYIAASKRFGDFDFTGGIGWGRFGSAKHISNPLSMFGSHFEDERDFDGIEANEPDDWFSGRDAGFFGGVEYFTPIKGLSIKLDASADRFTAERADFDFKAPPAWSAGVNYAPYNGVNMSIATQGGDKIMGNISLSSLIQAWPGIKDAIHTETLEPLRGFRGETSLPQRMKLSAAHEGIRLSNVTSNGYKAQAILQLQPDMSLPYQAGRAFVHMANHAGPDVERLTIIPAHHGLSGQSISIQRKDLERALAENQGSPEELWQNASFTATKGLNLRKLHRFEDHALRPKDYYMVLDNDVSLAEEDSTFLFRTSLLLGTRGTKLLGWLDYGAATRINLGNNLDRLALLRPLAAEPIRSDVAYFADRGVAIDHTYLGLTHSLRDDVHVALVGGYLEEMFGGFGGEILYRPPESRLAFGGEFFRAYGRNAFSSLNLDFTGVVNNTAFANLYYDIPEADVTLHAKAGRYLGEDTGGTLSLIKNFENGVQLNGFVTVTNESDTDLFGGETNAFNGISINVPLGGFHRFIDKASVRLDTQPLGRDTGQTIENPLSLYDLTTPFSYAHNVENWHDITP